ncbi:MAG: hypothetical protein HY718_14830, partial [Planctomycetes bacterium]|nr:hypothetical protein [Planctomycetota bacterium]
MLTGLATGQAAPDSRPGPQSGTYYAAAFGAKGDGKTDDTAAIQRTIDAAAEAGGGTVVLPAGRYLIAGSLRIG